MTPFITEAQLRLAVDAAPAGLLMTDEDGRIVFVNEQILRIFGFHRDELLGLAVEALVPRRIRAPHVALRDGYTNDPHAREMGAGRELVGIHKEGHEIPVEVGLTPFNAGGKRFVIAAVVDISARRRAESQLRDLESELRRNEDLSALGTLLSEVTRQIDARLQEVIQHAESLAGTLPPEPAAALDLAELVSSARRAHKLVDRVASVAERATGTPPAQP